LQATDGAANADTGEATVRSLREEVMKENKQDETIQKERISIVDTIIKTKENDGVEDLKEQYGMIQKEGLSKGDAVPMQTKDDDEVMEAKE